MPGVCYYKTHILEDSPWGCYSDWFWVGVAPDAVAAADSDMGVVPEAVVADFEEGVADLAD